MFCYYDAFICWTLCYIIHYLLCGTKHRDGLCPCRWVYVFFTSSPELNFIYDVKLELSYSACNCACWFHEIPRTFDGHFIQEENKNCTTTGVCVHRVNVRACVHNVFFTACMHARVCIYICV